VPTSLPSDVVLMEQAIRAKIRDILAGVPGVGQVHVRERFPESDAEDVALTTVPDPVSDGRVLTNVIMVGLPTVEEHEYTGDGSTQLNFTYPLTFDLEVRDEWAAADPPLEFTNSQDLATAIYLRARRAFKLTRDLGFNNCVHDYLQQVQAGVVDDEETGGKWHACDWSLTVKVTSVVN
jgi:hypothetical protein